VPRVMPRHDRRQHPRKPDQHASGHRQTRVPRGAGSVTALAQCTGGWSHRGRLFMIQ
jgi:hypothetical protein